MATITGNKGEWSEIYVLFKLLGDGKVFTGDENLNRIEHIFYPILKIIRSENDNSYQYNILNGSISIIENAHLFTQLPGGEFRRQAEYLFNQIIANSGSFSVPITEEFMSRIRCCKLKASSTDKTDIKLIIHDLKTGLCPELGFSIKSKLGSPSTLINASSATNFVYEITNTSSNFETHIDEINAINSRQKIRDRLNKISEYGGILKYTSMESPVFRNNLTMVDSCLPEILGHIILQYYRGEARSLADLTECVTRDNPMRYDMSCGNNYYEYKIKRLITDAVLGLMPASVWDGIYQANGGYLVVKEDGDVLCYHYYDKNIFESYLFHNLTLETPSSTRHRFGKIYKSDNKLLFKLNLQIRFI